ncbi:uncharacterized protein GGS22DRAFT_16633 [Annulohypoxylon maeteangense]|uniref:uncharacterized protein n=1 Tax=Annulohypoxylon maeteangense TaxID=1927788 RepID=UPI00200845E5|nr:uncharacterized protein GGS22DRAFT_16633 [Annulohypoxylon maeteangense]KAI0890657.1 hypothetical protein GGS22DRAFT_16633 [Annulohypoxylon maeteangense]
MSLPKPSVSLTGACSVLFNNTLYSYSSAGFESLALEDGAEWTKLASGQPVEGGVCVGSTPKDSSTAGFFVVGGQSGSADYPGLQKFTYSTGKWATITPQVLVTQNRTWHSATYINSSDSILIYSGSTDGQPNLSSQTFTVTASEPHSVLAFQSTISPPGVAPILLPWSESQAVLIGGNPTNTKVMLFDPAASWADSGITLADPLPKNSTSIKAAIIPGDDGSKHLYTFDLTTSPNTVNRTMLLNAGAAPMANAAPVSTTASTRRSARDGEEIEKRALTVADWPKYNSTLAPQNTRTQYSIATDSDGLVVMSGGNDDEILCMFNAKENSWKNATAVFGQQKGVFSIESSSSTSSVSSTTPTSTASSSEVPTSAITAAAAAPTTTSDDGSTTLAPTTLLGVVLGTIFGFAIILMALLFWIKHLRRRQNFVEAGHARRASGIPDEKDFFSPELAKASGGQFRGHAPQDSAGSFSSMAILMGKVQKPALQRKTSNDTNRSSIGSMNKQQLKNTISRPQPQITPEPQFIVSDEKGVSFAATTNDPKPRARPAVNRDGELRRSSGWNRYWSGGSALSVLGFGNSNSRRETGASEPSSVYSDRNRMTQDSATVPPLQVVEGRAELNRVHSASPTVAQYNPMISEGMSGQIERSASTASSSGYSSGIPASVNDTWDPAMAKKKWGNERAPSSAYSQSIYQTALGPPNTIPAPTGLSSQPQLAMASKSNDLSWLNLGENNHTYK